MALVDKEQLVKKSSPLSIDQILAKAYRGSEESYCYKMGRSLHQSLSFPCYKRADQSEDPPSQGCHILSRISPETPVTLNVEDFLLKGNVKNEFLNNRWKVVGEENKIFTIQKSEKELIPDEWCPIFCQRDMRPAFLSPTQLKAYEILRPPDRMASDVRAFLDLDKGYYEEVVSSGQYPKLSVAIGLAKKNASN